MEITSLPAYLTPVLLPSNFTSTLHYSSFQTWVAPLYIKNEAQPLKRAHTQKTSIMWTLTTLSSVTSCFSYHSLLPHQLLHTLLLYFRRMEPSAGVWTHYASHFYAIPFAWVLGLGTLRLYTELAFIECYVSDTSYELIPKNTLYVLSHLIFATIL